MGKYKVLFEGDRAVVIQLRDGVRTQDLVNEGVLIQREDGLYTKNNKKVIISESGFFLMSKPRLVNGVGGCGGSVYEVLKSVVISAGHVLECSDTLVVGNKYALLKPALLIKFLNQAGIPGCSGSMVYPIPVSYTHLTLPTILRV